MEARESTGSTSTGTSRACYAIATISTTATHDTSGEITTEIGSRTANSVYVYTGNSSGALADLPFHLIVTC